MMEERYHATTQNRFYPDMSNVNKKYFSGGKTYQSTYVLFTFVTSVQLTAFAYVNSHS